MAPNLYRGSIAISPHRQKSKSHGDLTATKMTTKELAQDVRDAVQEDLVLHCRVTDTDEFLNRLLPVQKTTLDKILQYMKEEKLYDPQTQRWKGFPDKCQKKKESKEDKEKPKENRMYRPFCAIAEKIRLFAEKQRSSDPEMGAAKWVDYHSKSPLSGNSQAAQLRPDILFALQGVACQMESKESEQPQQEGEVKEEKKAEVGQEGETKGKNKERVERQKKGEKEKGKEDVTIWWLQLVAAVEMKRTDQDWKGLLIQLFGYLRRILREQLDRRFVFGVTLGPDMMTVWLYDRSGVIGTKSAINIHEDPLKFIQVVAAFTLLSPEMLGFDPTIEMLVSPNLAVPSYRPNEAFIRAYQAAPHDRQWVVKMNDGSRYVTVETVSSVRAGFMRGRGSIVWVVVPFDRPKEESKIFVLKQSWRPCEVESEGDLYGKSECEYVGTIERCEEVLISGEIDGTKSLIRKGLDDSTPSLGKRSRDDLGELEGRREIIHVACTDAGDIKEVSARESGPPVAKIRTRVVLSTYGWLIKYFSTRNELLVVLRDAIRGHKYLYEKGVLHRDISPGNILIKWRPGSDADRPSTSGCLIDLDHAKKGKSFADQVIPQPVDDVELAEPVSIDLAPQVDHAKKAGLAGDIVKIPVSNKMIHTVHTMIQGAADMEVEEEVARLSLEFPCMNSHDGNLATVRIRAASHAVDAIQHAIHHATRFHGEQLCTSQHLRWKQVKPSYNFKFGEHREGSRTGTPPYTSGEILLTRRYFPGHKNVFHDAIHDLESFFWVLAHICVTRQGPGGVRRDELQQKNQEKKEYILLRRVVQCFFDSEEVADNKAEIFTRPEDFEEYVLGHFHGYFRSLKPLVREWFQLLVLGHKFHAFEYHGIHDMVLEILDHAIESALPEDPNEVGLKVLDDRKANIKKLLDGSSFGNVQQSPPPHTSPTSRTVVHDQSFYHPESQPSSPTPAPKKRTRLNRK